MRWFSSLTFIALGVLSPLAEAQENGASPNKKARSSVAPLRVESHDSSVPASAADSSVTTAVGEPTNLHPVWYQDERITNQGGESLIAPPHIVDPEVIGPGVPGLHGSDPSIQGYYEGEIIPGIASPEIVVSEFELLGEDRYAEPWSLTEADNPDQQFIVPQSDDLPQGWMKCHTYRPSDMPPGNDIYQFEDRWRIGFPEWDRYTEGSLRNPYRQSAIKGDYPLLGTEDLFFELTIVNDVFYEHRDLPNAAAGQVQQQFFQESLFVTADYFQGDNTFYPADWFLSITPAFRYRNIQNNNAGVQNSVQVDDVALQTAFLDLQLGITSDWYDTTDLSIGRQAFNSDFLGLIFADANDSIIYSGTAEALRTQWNLAFFNNVQKDAGSALNTFDSREQQLVMANIVRNDFIFPGFNLLLGANYDHDTFRQDVDAYWLEAAWIGRINRFEYAGAFIQALGQDKANPIAGRSVNVNAQLAALQVTMPMDWLRPKVAALYASGDSNPNDGTATGFDGIFDNPNFAGGGFSYLQRSAINVGGAQVSNTFSFYPNLRNKAAAPSNFVNPGAVILNTGFDARITARLQGQVNLNYYQFVHTQVLEQLAGQQIGKKIGIEANFGLIYKPLIVDNVIITGGFSFLDPGAGITDLTNDSSLLYTAFSSVTLVY